MSAVGAEFTDKIISIEGPQQVSPGSDVVVEVSYEASETRAVLVTFQKCSPPWTNYGFTSRSVPKGRGVLGVSLPIAVNAPIEQATYMFYTYISTKDGSWDERFDDLRQNHIDCVAAPSASNNDKWALSLSKDIRHPAAIENSPNNILNRRAESPPRKEEKSSSSPFHNHQNIPASSWTPRDNIRSKNVLKNGDFSKDISHWRLACNGGSEGSLSVNSGSELFCDITVDSGISWHVTVLQENLLLKNGQEYQLKFRARAKDASRQLRVLFKMPENIDTFLKDILLTDEMTEYEFNFTVNDATSENCQIEFHCGGAGDNGVILDDIFLEEVETDMILGSSIPPSKSLLFSIASYRHPEHIYKNHIFKREKWKIAK